MSLLLCVMWTASTLSSGPSHPCDSALPRDHASLEQARLTQQRRSAPRGERLILRRARSLRVTLRKLHCVSPDRLLLRFFCQRVLSRSICTALRENLIPLGKPYHRDSVATLAARSYGPRSTRSSLSQRPDLRSSGCRPFPSAPRAGDLLHRGFSRAP